MEKKLRIKVGNRLLEDFLHAFAIAPPTSGIVIRTWDCNDANVNIWSKSFFKEQTSASGMGIFGYDIQTSHLHIMLSQPILERNRRAIGAIAADDVRGNHLDELQR